MIVRRPSLSRKQAVQAAIAAGVTISLLTTMSGMSADQLGVAVNYTYSQVLPQIAQDGLP